MKVDKKLWEAQFSLIETIIESKGYKIVSAPGEEDRVEMSGDILTIFINSSCWPETRFYTLLHELGHIIISEDPKSFISENPMYVHASATFNDGRKERAKAYRVSLISEEIEAWRIGKRMATSLGLYLDDKKYNKHMTESVMSYIDWAAG